MKINQNNPLFAKFRGHFSVLLPYELWHCRSLLPLLNLSFFSSFPWSLLLSPHLPSTSDQFRQDPSPSSSSSSYFFLVLFLDILTHSHFSSGDPMQVAPNAHLQRPPSCRPLFSLPLALVPQKVLQDVDLRMFQTRPSPGLQASSPSVLPPAQQYLPPGLTRERF